MKKPRKNLLFWILFPLGWTILSALLVFYFDLANGPLVFFILEIVLLVALFALRVVFRGKKWWVKLVIWLSFVFLTGSNMVLCRPIESTKNAYYYDNPVYVETPLELNEGKVKGVYNKDQDVEIYAGIQYAEVERWKEPKPHTWEGVKDGSKFGPRSMQPKPNSIIDTVLGIYAEKTWRPNYLMQPLQSRSESESLQLNIWKPKNVTNAPILVYIHGGSLTNGSSAADDINGETMAKHGIIMITIQYRLGVFGYFAHEDLANENEHHTTGNYGLLDQIYALNWINNNAANIGGDKKLITIAGESAGSSSVSALCTSPLAKGLFKYAIGESSSLVMKEPPHTYRTREKAYEVGENILKEFKCSSIEELRKVPAEKLAETKNANQEMMLDGYALTKNPYQVYVDHENNEEALLNGYNVREADAFVIPSFLFSPTNKKNIESRLAEYLNEKYAGLICDLYKDEIEKDAFSALNEIMSVYWFIMPHHVWSNMALTNGEPVYRYMFTKENGFYGTYHSGEIVYAYGNLDKLNKPYAYDAKDFALSDAMVDYWSNFVKTGNPNGEGLHEWKTYNPETASILELGENIREIPDKFVDLYNILNQYLDEKVASM